MPRVLLLAIHTGTPLLFLLLLPGCKGKTTVEGEVLFQGKKLPVGFITFSPEGEVGTARGAEIKDGKFRVPDITPGKKRVLITTPPEVSLQPGENGKFQPKFSAPPVSISPESSGNYQLVEITPGKQVINFQLGKK